MNESFLSYLWMNHLLGINPVTTNGENVRIFSVGLKNSDSGPDFINARIQIGEILWSGNVEIHVRSSDWNRHNHQNDPSYNNVILHVVFENDIVVKKQDGIYMPVLVLDNEFITMLHEKYEELMKSQMEIPCQILFKEYSSTILPIWLQQLSVKRLERKVKTVSNLHLQLKGDWAETFFVWLSGGFGLKINQEAFMNLTKSIGLKRYIQNKSDVDILESIFYGQSGLLPLEKCDDEYVLNLLKEYNYYANKYAFIPLKSSEWKFLRLHAESFPTIRISQLARFLNQTDSLFSLIMETEELEELQKVFCIKASPYWDRHYQFGIESSFKIKQTGTQFADNVLINCVIPLLFSYGYMQGIDELKERAFGWLEQIKSEQNTILRFWNSLSVKAENAAQSQALIELKNNYCKQKNCLNCLIGIEIMKK